MSEHTTEDLVRAYVIIRDQRAALKKQLEAQDAPLRDQLDKLQHALRASLDAQSATSVKTAHGTVYLSHTAAFTCADWGALHEWVKREGRPDVLERRLSKSVVAEIKEESGSLPPAVTEEAVVTVGVRRG